MGFCAMLCIVVGLVFLTVAAWIALEASVGSMYAAVVIGGTYMGIGLILLGIMSSDASPRHPEPRSDPARAPASDDIGPQVIAAFVSGLKAGQKARS